MKRLTRLLILALPVLLLSCDDSMIEPLAPSADVTTQAAPVASQWELSPNQNFTGALMCRSPYNYSEWDYQCDWTYDAGTHTFTGTYYDNGGSFWIHARVTDGASNYATSGSVKLYLCRASVRGPILPMSECTTKGGDGRWVASSTSTMPSSGMFPVNYSFAGSRDFTYGWKLKYNGRGSGFKSTSIAFDFNIADGTP